MKERIIGRMIEHLDTRDKRFMFLKIFFPSAVPLVQLEGNIKTCSWDIFGYFEKRTMTEELEEKLIETFYKQNP